MRNTRVPRIPSLPKPVTQAELSILQQLADGSIISAIKLEKRSGVAVTPHALLMRVDRLKEKMGASTTVHAVAMALRQGLVD